MRENGQESHKDLMEASGKITEAQRNPEGAETTPKHPTRRQNGHQNGTTHTHHKTHSVIGVRFPVLTPIWTPSGAQRERKRAIGTPSGAARERKRPPRHPTGRQNEHQNGKTHTYHKINFVIGVSFPVLAPIWTPSFYTLCL